MKNVFHNLLRPLFAVAFVLILAAPGRAHEIRPGLLTIVEKSPGLFDATWKVPARGEQLLRLKPVLPPSLELVSTFPPRKASKSEVAWSYMSMGVSHILEGIDHLLFLLAMLLLITGFGKVVKTVTAFTVAHSITLALATLGVVNVPSAPTEAIISLSIVFLALEIVRKTSGKKTMTEEQPWVVAFGFGLFHGLGFAGALSEVGVPHHEVPLALLMFNVGVELGQLAFVVVVAALGLGLKRLARSMPEVSLPAFSRRVVPYAIGGVAAFWTIERTAAFLGG